MEMHEEYLVWCLGSFSMGIYKDTQLQCHHWKMVLNDSLILLRFWGWHWGGGVPYIPHDVFQGYAGNDGDWCLPRFGSLGINVEDYFKMRDLSIFLKGSLRSNIQFGSFTI